MGILPSFQEGWPGAGCHSRVCYGVVDPAWVSPAGLTTANRMFPICVHVNCQNSGTPEFWWSIIFAKKMDCRVKPGNDGGVCVNLTGTGPHTHGGTPRGGSKSSDILSP